MFVPRLPPSLLLLTILGSYMVVKGRGGSLNNEGEMYLCASLNVPHADGVIIRAGDELSPPRGAQRHGLDGTSVGAYQRAIVPATCIQEPNVTLQSEKHVYPRS